MVSIAERRLTAMMTGWDDLCATRNENDYDKAEFLTAQRQSGAYRRGRGGDFTFKADVVANLRGIGGETALSYIKVLRQYPNRNMWTNLGGFASLYYLTGLVKASTGRAATPAEQRRLAVICIQKMGEDYDDRPITLAMVRKIAKDEGFTSRRGRRAASVLATHNRTLAEFIVNEYDEVPAQVQDAMPRDLAARLNRTALNR